MGSRAGIVSLKTRGKRCGKCIAYAIFSGLIAGCASNPPAPIVDRTTRDGAELQPVIDDISVAPAENPERTYAALAPGPAPRAASEGSAPATRTLLAAAEADIAARNYEAAAVNVERAIRIAPQDPSAWHKLAKVRFAAGDYAQAKATALRSNALAQATPRIIAANWFLIAEVERINGDEAAANEAVRKARTRLNAERNTGERN